MVLSLIDYMSSYPLAHKGDCRLIGVTADLTIYVEEIYGEHDWMAQHALRLDGQMIASTDENAGLNPNFEPLMIPALVTRSQPCERAATLNFGGARHRGLREPERINELVRPLTIQTRMALIEHLKLDIMPPMLLGIAESYVLAEALLFSPDVLLVCRRLRLAYALPRQKLDEETNNQPYDYDTLVLYVAHDYNLLTDDDQLPPERALAGLPGVKLRRPMDCIIAGNHIFIAEGGTPEQASAVHIWRINEK